MKQFSFEHLGLNEPLCQHLAQLGFDTPTPIQEQAIPIVLRGQDIIASAQTGSGKTASFLLPLLHILGEMPLKARMPRAIVMEPTRELALQVFDQFERFSNGLLKAALLVGGESMTQQEKIIKLNPDVLIVTPGRLLDLCEREKLMLIGIRYVVIDEADRMLDMGFLPDVKRIMERIPVSRQTMLFSATYNDEIKKLTSQFMLAPKIINTSRSGSTVASIEQFFVMAPDKEKRIAMRYCLAKYGVKDGIKIPTIIFCNRKTQIKTLLSSLSRHGFSVDSLHGDLQQSMRNLTVEKFKAGETHILVASDVAARGLDVEDLGLVINFDVPINAEDYVHRIGRTGRAGKSGYSVTLVEARDQKQWAAIKTLTQQVIAELVIPAELLNKAPLVKNDVEKRPAKKIKIKKQENAQLLAVEELSTEAIAVSVSALKNTVEKKRPRLIQKNKPTSDFNLVKGESFDVVAPVVETSFVKSNHHRESQYSNYYDRNVKGFGNEVPSFFKQDSYRKFLVTADTRVDVPFDNKVSFASKENITVKTNDELIHEN
ncbi:MAG: DEAD/DEAH box helicase [Candidatus Paracaedibacteraceae bacterium]|nr:DEAD/DEAH box helicase [Candidatus Paracaedibacteraceae bacterium]